MNEKATGFKSRQNSKQKISLTKPNSAIKNTNKIVSNKNKIPKITNCVTEENKSKENTIQSNYIPNERLMTEAVNDLENLLKDYETKQQLYSGRDNLISNVNNNYIRSNFNQRYDNNIEQLYQYFNIKNS